MWRMMQLLSRYGAPGLPNFWTGLASLSRPEKVGPTDRRNVGLWLLKYVYLRIIVIHYSLAILIFSLLSLSLLNMKWYLCFPMLQILRVYLLFDSEFMDPYFTLTYAVISFTQRFPQIG